MPVIDVYELFALGNFLACWNEDVSYEENIELIKNNDNDYITVWEPFEYHEREWVAEQIENMKESVKNTFIPRKIGR